MVGTEYTTGYKISDDAISLSSVEVGQLFVLDGSPLSLGDLLFSGDLYMKIWSNYMDCSSGHVTYLNVGKGRPEYRSWKPTEQVRIVQMSGKLKRE
jgi:hypothetical protein